MSIKNSSITDKKVLITGGAGFIGANFVYKFLEMGGKVIVAEREGANLWRLEKVKDKIDLRYTDLTDYDKIEKFIAEIRPQVVVHLAAYGAYQRFQQDVKLTIDTNLKGTINLVNACQKAGVECFINTGSSSEYGLKNEPMKETDVLEADNLYAITKAGTTMYCQLAAKKSGFPAVTIRPFAVYGYFEEKERLIPTIIKSCLAGTELKLSSPDSVRDFIFVEDLVEGYLAAIENIGKIKGEIFNLGSGCQNNIDEVVKIVKKITGSDVVPTYGAVANAQTEPRIWVSDISKAKKLLGWEPKFSLGSALQKNVDWFRNNLSFYE